MKWFLLWALGGTGVLIVAMCLLVLFLRGRVRRRHRVDRKIQTGAPLAWMVDPRAPARLHRRLARVGSTTDAVIADHQSARGIKSLGRRTEPSPLASTAGELKARAVETDRQLARVAVLAPTARRGALAELDKHIGELETAAARLAALSATSLTPSSLQHQLDDDVSAQVARLTEAQRELDALDAVSGLRPASSNPLATATAPTAAAPPPLPRPSRPSPATGSGGPAHG